MATAYFSAAGWLQGWDQIKMASIGVKSSESFCAAITLKYLPLTKHIQNCATFTCVYIIYLNITKNSYPKEHYPLKYLPLTKHIQNCATFTYVYIIYLNITKS